MSGPVRFLMIAALALLITGSVYFVSQRLFMTGGLLAPVPTATGSVPSAVQEAQFPDLLELRLHYCDGNKTYALLSMPRDANFSLGPAAGSSSGVKPIPVTGQGPQATLAARRGMQPSEYALGANACAEVGITADRKLLLCRGQGLSRFTITVSNAAGSAIYSLALPACAAPRPVGTPPGTPVPSSPPPAFTSAP